MLLRIKDYCATPGALFTEGAIRQRVKAASNDPSNPFRQAFKRVGGLILIDTEGLAAWIDEADKRDRRKHSAGRRPKTYLPKQAAPAEPEISTQGMSHDEWYRHQKQMLKLAREARATTHH